MLLADVLPPAPKGHLPLLPQALRLVLFARHEGPAVLLTTPDRLELFAGAGLISGERLALNPSPEDWANLPQKVVLDVLSATEAFPEDPSQSAIHLKKGEHYPREALIARLERLGYASGEEAPAHRLSGDRLEILLDGGERLAAEFFGDELDRLRRLTADEEFSGGVALEEAALGPSSLHLSDEIWNSTRLKNLSGRVFLDAPERYTAALGVLENELWSALAGREVTAFGPSPLFSGTIAPPENWPEKVAFYRGRISQFLNDVLQWQNDGKTVFVGVRHPRAEAHLRERLREHGAAEVQFLRLSSEGGWQNESAVFLSEDVLYGFQGGEALRGKRLAGKPITDALGLHPGDHLIHPDHGVGRFLGLETLPVLGVVRDYLNIEYAKGALLRVPIEMLAQLRRHPGSSDSPPPLSNFDKKSWSATKEKARQNAEMVAARLLRHYAAREATPGFAFGPLPEWDVLVEENFPFSLTADQAQALKETFADQAKAHPMDRLVAGDVGFGKTEVALRAAWRVVGHEKQVAVLVPTTLLADQHGETFRERLRDLPARVEVLSRFTSAKAAKEILKGLEDGSVDIVIGTHRLLSDGTKFARLGLVIIDEEHRFGVGQKERLRGLRGLEADANGVLPQNAPDTLSLSATPIPRTLYMSTVGLRDISTIQTPPEGRQPIQTHLLPFDASTVRHAILSEIERGGRAFYIHDRIATIASRQIFLQNLLPEARIGVAHGRMNEGQLEEVMMGFEKGDFDVLLATTIVETGLDIPEANTILIERADRLGLAQLYQLRGRVGRRRTEAHAYLFYPGRVTSDAERRLWAISDLHDLGSGHLLAQKDMEIRGVGNILGEEQHGHVQLVSMELYSQMLAEAVAKLRGLPAPVQRPSLPTVDLPLEARFDAAYFGDEESRIKAYGQLAEAHSLQAVARFERDLRRRFGVPDEVTQRFIDLSKLRLLAARKEVTEVKSGLGEVSFVFALGKNFSKEALRATGLPFKEKKFPPTIEFDVRGVPSADLVRVLIDALALID